MQVKWLFLYVQLHSNSIRITFTCFWQEMRSSWDQCGSFKSIWKVQEPRGRIGKDVCWAGYVLDKYVSLILSFSCLPVKWAGHPIKYTNGSGKLVNSTDLHNLPNLKRARNRTIITTLLDLAIVFFCLMHSWRFLVYMCTSIVGLWYISKVRNCSQ